MLRNKDRVDEQLKAQITNNPGISFSQLLARLRIPESTLRYRLVTLELTGEIRCERERNRNRYFAEAEKT